MYGTKKKQRTHPFFVLTYFYVLQSSNIYFALILLQHSFLLISVGCGFVSVYLCSLCVQRSRKKTKYFLCDEI